MLTMQRPAMIKKIFGKGTPRLTLLFFHGLTGDPEETWKTSGTPSELWPSWFEEEFPGIAAYTVGYPASIFEQWAKKEMGIHERAANILECLAANGIGSTPIAMITHSLGGLLAKEVLRISSECDDDDWKLVAQQTKLVAFLATPHAGASLAAALKFLAPRLSSRHIELLSNDSGYLTSLNLAFRTIADKHSMRSIAYYEKHKTKNLSIVVSPESADPGVGKFRPVAIDADHISICKPSSKDDVVYGGLCRHIKAILKTCPLRASDSSPPDSFEAEDYGKASPIDRRDLLQKLIDAGREHEYRKANELQNKFAQRYYKHGLYTVEKVKSDSLLASVEQRFLTHVYTAKICKKASDDEVSAALQAHVIDPLCGGGSDKDRLSASAVLQALYFLTEQCHIQWDAP